jgi:hypothetical protein
LTEASRAVDLKVSSSLTQWVLLRPDVRLASSALRSDGRARISRYDDGMSLRNGLSGAVLATVCFQLACGAATSAAPSDAQTSDASSLDATSSDAAVIDAATDVPTHEAGLHVRILFLGNSYTYVNDLPGTLESLLLTVPSLDAPAIDSTTVGGATLQQLIDTTDAVTKIRTGGFTHVVLQEQSVTPCLDPTGYVNAATVLAKEAKSAGSKVLIYGTWPRKAGDAVYAESWSGGTPDALERCLEAGFASAVKATGGTLVDVGAAWMRVLAAKPDFPLYQADGSHPLIGGTFLGATLFLREIAGVRASSLSTHPTAISDADAVFLESIADGG